MYDLVFALKRLAETHREGSYATQANRKAMLKQIGRQLVDAGYKQMGLRDLKGRHVRALLERWQRDGISAATQKNRLAALRWWAKQVHNPGAVRGSNTQYGLAPRPSRPRVSKAKALPEARLAQVRHAHVRMALLLQQHFGLRREEAIKIKPHQADRGDRLVLQGSWTKGGRPREIPILTLAQREVLDQAKAFVKLKSASLIPAHKTYVQQLRTYEHATRLAGLDHLHGLRHAYAQQRFADLAGFPCPLAGGPAHAALTPVQREADYDARLMVSAELGHVREAITVAYLGR
jgi:site-specific recombinase XerC